MIKIFVSSTSDDLRDYRERARELITALGFTDIAMERWGADRLPPKAVVQAAVRESDIYVGIIAWRYGSQVPGEHGVSYTEYEYDLAGQCDMPRLLFLMECNHPWPPSRMDRDLTRIDSFRDKATTGQTLVTFFTSERNFSLKLCTSLSKFVPESKQYKLLSSEDKAVLDLLRLTQEDFLARRNEIENQADEGSRQWFIPGIARCNLGLLYISRDTVLKSVAKWLLPREHPFLFLVGPSGIGKTNFLLDFTQRFAGFKQDVSGRGVLTFPLGQYNLRHPIEKERRLSLLDNLCSFLNQQPSLFRLALDGILESLVVSGRIVLALDGLDEFARNHGDEECERLFTDLANTFLVGHPKLIISCRDHTFKRLVQRPWFPRREIFSEVPVPELTDGEVTTAIEKRLRRDSACYAAVTGNQVLLGFARKPFLLEIMCTIRPDRWMSLRKAQTPARLYDAWFDEVIAASTNPVEPEQIDETRIAAGKIAGEMLRARSDLISESSLRAAQVTPECLQMLTRRPFGILIKETKDEWGFVHASFREFALAKTAATELISRSYDLLAKADSFDYVGAETYRFLRDLIPVDERLLELLEHAVNTTTENHNAWNNIVRNAFEAIGMIGEAPAERFIDTALEILCPRAEVERNRPIVSSSTKWNIVRCLERLHRSAPRPYCEYMMTVVWPRRPDFMWFGAVAVRGFHMQHVEPGYFPPMQYLIDGNTGDNPMQRAVSDCLLSVLESLGARTPGDESAFLEINCTHALIRWLHESDINRVKALLEKGGLSANSKGNLFQAFLRFKRPEVFEGGSQLFAGMTLWWCYVARSMVPESFVFRNVTFRMRQASRIEGFQDSAFESRKDDVASPGDDRQY